MAGQRLGNRAFIAHTLANGIGSIVDVDDKSSTLTIRSLATDGDGSVRVTDAITLSQRAPRKNATARCVATADEGLLVLHVTSGVWDDPGQLYAMDVSDPTQLVVRGAYRGEAWPVPYAIRDHTLFELSDAGLSRWSIVP